MMRLNTKLLFYQLLPLVRPATVLDVGSLDGTHAKRFRQLLPDARIVAFEANPHNVAALRGNAAFQAAGIELVAQAVSDRDGTLTFFVEATSDAEPWRHGISSTRQRTAASLGAVRTDVDAVRLDTFVNGRGDLHAPMALWVDVEGASYEVLQGIEAIRAHVLVIHCEVETRPFWVGQHLKPDVEALLGRLGYTCVARGPLDEQHDLVCIRTDALPALGWRLRALLVRTWLLTQAQNRLGSGRFRALGDRYLKRASRRSAAT